MNDISVVIVASSLAPAEDKCIGELFCSLETFGYSPIVIGEKWNGHGDKPRLLLRALRNGLVKTEYMILSDAYDVVFLLSPDKILEIIRDRFSDSDIVFSAEKACYPFGDCADAFEQNEGPWKFPNGGFFCGKTAAILKLLEHIKADEIIANDANQETIDQGIWLRTLKKGDHGLKISIDNECLICMSICEAIITEDGGEFVHRQNSKQLGDDSCSDVIISKKEGWVMNAHESSVTCALHFNGGGKFIMDQCLKTLGFRY